ncbi:unnamed protein product [Euphydryas editha]|uniref:Uncharacterized protein n=1 Tax=Euphydryas editha TaxID=104508 RepID=A0AAU9TPF4_EUPED|nr:unnamed protein product [Euphydryas editha]
MRAHSGELTNVEIVTSILPVANEVEEFEQEESKFNQHDFTIKDTCNALVVMNCVFLKKHGSGEGIIKSITKLDCALNTITNIIGKQTTIYDC